MTTAAELRAAAEYFAAVDGCTCDPDSGVTNCMGCDVSRMARHILATVHADDDEPVTEAKLESFGVLVNHTPSGNRYYRHTSGLVGFDPNRNQWYLNGASCALVVATLGQLRSLLSGLGQTPPRA